MTKKLSNLFAITEHGAKDLIMASVSSFLVYLINMLPAMLLMFAVDELIASNIGNKIIYAAIAVFILLLMYFLLSKEYDRQFNATYAESANLRIDIADILSKLPLSYFSKHNLSDISQTIMSDVEAIEHAMSHAMSHVIAFALFFPIISVLLLAGNFYLGLAIVLPFSLNFILVLMSKKVQSRQNLRFYKKLRENSDSFQETLELQQDIKSYGLCNKTKQTLYSKIEESEKIHLRTELSAMWLVGISGLLTATALAIVIITGTVLFSAGKISLVYFIGYILAAIKIKELVDSVSQNMVELFYINPRINRIKEMRGTQCQEGKNTKINSFDIELKNVSFSYGDDNKVLSNINFSAKQNEVTALVGLSGSGKTSILRLVSRLYDYDGGKITIGGQDIKEVSTKNLFENISIVFQDVTLFNATIMDNIRIGKASASDEEVKHAAALANCTEFINKLPQGFNTLIGENGASLSGGERQRLSIARAFLKNAPIIILDEISASLDVDNEKIIQESLNRLIKNKTVLIISHRLKSIENVDKIVVINNGIVDNFGKHADLLKKSKLYSNLIERAKLAEAFVY